MKESNRLISSWRRIVTVERGEWRALFWSFSGFFALLCGYYIVRPMRDEMGIAGGVEKLQWMFSGTFLAMLAAVPLFGWVTRRFPPRRFLPYVYFFFIGNLVLFFALFKSDFAHAYVARAFFIWASVFNLFIISVFWSFMADIFPNERAKRLFGIIAAGGTAGALAGPALTAMLVLRLGPANLLPLSAAFLGWAVLSVNRLIAWRQGPACRTSASEPGSGGAQPDSSAGRAMGGTVLAGVRLVLQSPYLMGICLFMLLFTTLSTFLYFEQAYIVRMCIEDPARRTALFASMDFSVNALTLGLQLFLTGRIVRRFGIGWTLAAVPILLAMGFLALGAVSALGVIVVVQVLRRAGDYAVTRPAREMLFVVLSKEEKYKAKNFIDTVIYRGGDVVSAWVYAGMQAMGMSMAAISLAALPLTGVWAWISVRLGRSQERMAANSAELRDLGI